MSKINNILKNNIKRIIGITLVITITYVIGVGASSLIEANEVLYDNTTSKLISTNVQSAIDELNTKANEYILGSPIYYAYGQYKGWCNTTNTSCNFYEDFPETNTTPPTDYKVYAAKYEDGQYGSCINKDGKEYCFRARNWTVENEYIQEVFRDGSCELYMSYTQCSTTSLLCRVYAEGYVLCSDLEARKYCAVYSDGCVFCGDSET